MQETKEKITSVTWYKAPDFRGLSNWINSEPIESITKLQWKVVLLEFWTLGCINCINTHEHTQAMQTKYEDQGFTVLWLHAPEFAYERLPKNVIKSVAEHRMTYPIALDNDFATWKAYNNRYWPAFYLIDAKGDIRYTHFGEGKYDEKEQAILELLEEKDKENIEQDFLSDNLSTNTAKISIPKEEILSGWPAKDGIPAINNPKFITQEKALEISPYLWEDDLWLVLHRWDEARFYGYDVLVWHEIVNDEIAWEKVSVTFCPLCGSAIVYNRNVNGREINFWVSGKLYNSNLLMYDTHDETLWSQSLWEAVVWDQLWTKLSVVKLQLMNYREFQENFPNGTVLSNDTWYNRHYGEIPYGNYDDSHDLYFPVSGSWDIRYHPKKLFYIVSHDGQSFAFAWDELREEWTWEIQLWEDIYKATFSWGVVNVTLNSEIIPGYFEMWFSWINHNPESKNIWNK